MFKFGTKEGEYIGFNDPRLTIASDAFTGSDDGFGGQNISVNVTGWYTVIMSVSIKGTDYAFTLDIAPGEVCLIGNAIGDWTSAIKANSKHQQRRCRLCSRMHRRRRIAYVRQSSGRRLVAYGVRYT